MDARELRIILGLADDEAFDVDLGVRGEAALGKIERLIDRAMKRSSDPEALAANILVWIDEYLERQARMN